MKQVGIQVTAILFILLVTGCTSGRSAEESSPPSRSGVHGCSGYSQAYWVQIQAVSIPEHQSTERQLITVFHGSDPNIRLTLAASLTRKAENDPAKFREIVDALTHPDPRVRWAAAWTCEKCLSFTDESPGFQGGSCVRRSGSPGDRAAIPRLERGSPLFVTRKGEVGAWRPCWCSPFRPSPSPDRRSSARLGPLAPREPCPYPAALRSAMRQSSSLAVFVEARYCSRRRWRAAGS